MCKRIAAAGTLTIAMVAATSGQAATPKYTYEEGCKKFIDPVGMVFYGRGANPQRVAEVIEDVYDGMKKDPDDASGQYFRSRGCKRTTTAADDGAGVANRTHIRLGAFGRRVLGTPHRDVVRVDCVTKDDVPFLEPNHYIPRNGFRDARREFKRAFKRAGYRVKDRRLRNRKSRPQCEGKVNRAKGDGIVTSVRMKG